MPKKKKSKNQRPKLSKKRVGTLLIFSGPVSISKELARTRQINIARARAARHKILARTAAARAELDKRIAGADMTDLEHLPIVTGLKPKPVPVKKPRKQAVAPAGYPAVPDPKFLRKMSKKPRPGVRKVRSLPTSDAAIAA